MKKYLLVLVVLLPIFCFSQVGTTEEEWNYAKKGYKILKDNGLSEKEGYLVVPLSQYSEKFNSGTLINDFTFHVLYRKSDKSIAGTIIYFEQIQTEINQRYFEIFALPNEFTTDLIVLDMFKNQFNNLNSPSFFRSYSFALTKYFLRLSNMKGNLEKGL